MKIIKKSNSGVDFLTGILRSKTTVLTKAIFWKIKHRSGEEDICLKIGRYKKSPVKPELECDDPKSELTLDGEEFSNLCDFISQNHQPFKDGAESHIAIEEDVSKGEVEYMKSLFGDAKKKDALEAIVKSNILPEDLISSIQLQSRFNAVSEFEEMLKNDLLEGEWQKWLTKNSWVLGTEYVKIVDERNIDTENISDYLMEAYDGFLDIVEIKRPDGGLKFWSSTKDHGNYVPHSDLMKAITQATKYIHEVEREANSVKFQERIKIRTIKPRCVLIFGRSNDWDDERKESYRILNSNYHNLTIMTYDYVLERAKRILGINENEGDNK